jgi:hypothetical protein
MFSSSGLSVGDRHSGNFVDQNNSFSAQSGSRLSPEKWSPICLWKFLVYEYGLQTLQNCSGEDSPSTPKARNGT